MSPRLMRVGSLVAIWSTLIIIVLLTRPLIPVDEIRYLSVAWEMWLNNDWLVMHLSGVPYSQKPPLLFWLVNFQWHLFGVNEWSARLVSPLFGLATVLLIIHLARKLWPDIKEPSYTVPWILLGTTFWTLYSTATMFDMLLAFFTVVAALGIYHARHGSAWKGWLLTAVAIGGGALAKGPVILVHVLPLALFAPWWAAQPTVPRRQRWYPALTSALLLGAGICLIWAIPAAIAGGAEYREAILWGQTANRITESFAHQRPWWWYLPMLPLLLFPWFFWSALWRKQWVLDEGERFCLVWCIATVVIFSFISGKQVHYLLPAFPAFALLAARRISRLEQLPRTYIIGIVVIVVGVICAVLPYWQKAVDKLPLVAGVSPLWGVVIIAIGVGVYYWQPSEKVTAVRKVALACIAVVALVHLGVVRVIGPAYDLSAVAKMISDAQAEGIAVAYPKKYHGHYQFLGRLTKPLDELVSQTEIDEWLKQHKNGIVVKVYGKERAELFEKGAIYTQDYRSGRLALLPASDFLALQ